MHWLDPVVRLPDICRPPKELCGRPHVTDAVRCIHGPSVDRPQDVVIPLLAVLGEQLPVRHVCRDYRHGCRYSVQTGSRTSREWDVPYPRGEHFTWAFVRNGSASTAARRLYSVKRSDWRTRRGFRIGSALCRSVERQRPPSSHYTVFSNLRTRRLGESGNPAFPAHRLRTQ